MKLKWKTSYSTKKAVSATSEWCSKVFRDKIRPVDVTIQQIEEYMKKSKDNNSIDEIKYNYLCL